MSQYANMMSLSLSHLWTLRGWYNELSRWRVRFLLYCLSAGSIWQWNEKGLLLATVYGLDSSSYPLLCVVMYISLFNFSFLSFPFFSCCCYSIQLRTTTAILAAKNTSCSVQLAADWPSFWAVSSPSSTSSCAPTRRRCTTLRLCPPTLPPSR